MGVSLISKFFILRRGYFPLLHIIIGLIEASHEQTLTTRIVYKLL